LLFDKLWISVEACPYLAKVISAECEDLQRGDIPLFSTRPNSLHVWTSTNKCVPNLFEESPLSSVERRLLELNDANLSLQRWLIRASLATSVNGNSPVQPYGGTSSYQRQGLADRAQLLGAACAVGDKLECSAITWNESASWVGLALADDFQWRISTTMLDLYDGLPGIALFLAYLGSITGELRYTRLAKRTCKTMLRRVQKYEPRDLGVGGFAGWGGIIYALTHLGSLWHDSGLLSHAEDIVQHVRGLIASDEHLDIIAGSAGCIGSLIVLYQQRQSPNVLAAAKGCGEHLIASAKQMPTGIGWIIPNQIVPLAGFAHGVAGIAWALFQLAEVTGEEVFAKTAEASIAYERSLFDRETANWSDLRTWRGSTREPGKSVMSAWCHGAAGIGLARLGTRVPAENDEVRREIDTALSTTFRAGFGRNHSLCHGDAGSIELFQRACLVLKDQHWNLEAHRVAHGIVEAISQNEFRCGTPLNVDSPGLMTGLAGIGYELLRLARPDRVPSVLTLEPALET
jgi:type 2 lantibiotic biosynthesis protein LanM